MMLLDSWKDSIAFFEKKNVSMFFLVTLKAIQTTYAQIIKYLGIPLCLLIALDICVPQKSFNIFHMLFFVFMYLTLRSSVEKKTWHYYKKYCVHGICLLAWLMVIFFVLSKIGYWWWSLITMIVTFAIFFFLDSKPSLKNFIYAHTRAIKMVIYNAPVSLLVGVLLMVLWVLYMALVKILSYYIVIPIADASMLFMPIEAAVLSNLYIKWFHEQFDLYYVQPK
ncbi:MAG TPA: hypothetical protein PKD74_01865 [Candidatus Dependentiae bacterium]|jgi:hypothetical protein|nr:hypothetical protein [Candidatus Dependentiae bacterium]